MLRRRALLASVALLPGAALAQPSPPIMPPPPPPRRKLYGPRVGAYGPRDSGQPPATLDLALLGPTLDPRITFTRASVGTYFDSAGVMQTAASGAPRFDYDPVSRQARGLLIEEARTNLIFPAIPGGTWSLNGASFVANAGVAPDGTTTATKLNDNTSNARHDCSSTTGTAAASGTSYVCSVFLKAGEQTTAQLLLSSAVFGALAWLNVNLASGTLGTNNGSANTASGIIPVGNGWYRAWVAAPATASVAAAFGVATTNNNAAAGRTVAYIGAGTGVYAWGAQIEAGSFPTSYIPTTGATVARAIETAIASGLSLAAANGASLAVEATALQNTIAGQNCFWAQADDGTSSNLLAMVTPANSANVRYNLTVGGSQIVSGGDTATGVRPVTFKAAESFNKTVLVPAMNGVVAASQPAVTTLPTLTRLQIGTGGIVPIDGYMRRVRYWSRALTNSELQQVTS